MRTSVLFVDDDLSVLHGLVRRMRKEPFELRTATSGEEALGILARSSIDLIVSDMNMPGMSGMDFLAKVAKEYPDCVRIMLTGRPTLDVAMDAINNGEVYRFLTKPYDAGALAALIRKALEQRTELLETRSRRGRRDGPGSEAGATPENDLARRDPENIHTHFSPCEEGRSFHNPSEPFSPLSKDFFARLNEPGHRMRIRQYEVERLIGKGSMGIVLKAHDPGLARDVALKVLAPSCAESPVAHQRFAQEARYAAAIRHENVVTIFAVSDVGGIPFLVMEYVPGLSLQDRLDTREKFAVPEIIRIGRQIALGLAAAHELRLIHRDIKPANILLEHGTQCVRITDFGLARALDGDTNLSQKGLLLGTPLFMSPEQVNGEPLTPATDLFSLGSVLYTLCTGKRPFSSTSLTKLLRSIADDAPPPIQSLNRAIPEWLVEIIQKLQAKNPQDRFPSATAVAECLR